MEKDKLEKFIAEHRQEFDNHEPPDFSWEHVPDNKIVKESKYSAISILWKVAAVFVIFCSSYYFFAYMNRGKSSTAKVAYTGQQIVFFQKRTHVPNPVVSPNTIKVSYELAQIDKTPITEKNKLDSIETELNELKAYYASRIEQRKNEILIFTAGNPKIEKDIAVEMEQLDSAYKALKNDLKENIDNSEVISAMIQNYRIRLEILENILQQLKKANQHEKTNKQYEI